MSVTLNEQEQSTLSVDKQVAAAIVRWEPSTLVADYGRLQLYGHDYHWLLSQFLQEQDIIVADCEPEFYPTYLKVGMRVIPYDVTGVDTEREELVIWL